MDGRSVGGMNGGRGMKGFTDGRTDGGKEGTGREG